ncbi:hypothetical protein CCR94_14635 [Rhodoblastus sphagnicola]|uniref:CcoQ/FixQ family Cbb3-type cytochrome c oxidase assembly chaperone n=1 Tax=Rhodoblastus sphagnicola TaxID=333368 RepID=A0A2S6N5H9_9HYPH|nr:hypothetical protein CCR94_14635 [Rhodoblastus sphagnicola]
MARPARPNRMRSSPICKCSGRRWTSPSLTTRPAGAEGRKMDVEAFFAQAKVVSILLVVVAFLGVIAFALWPSKKKSFDEAARLPLNED